MGDRSGINLPFIERTINGVEYRSNRLMFEDWAVLTEDLASMLGEPAASLLRGDMMLPDQGEGGSLLETIAIMLGQVDLPGVVRGIASKLTAKNLLGLAKHLGKSVLADGKPLTYQAQQMHWPHHMRDLAPVVGLFLEAQYADFFEGFGGLLPPTPTLEESRSEKASST